MTSLIDLNLTNNQLTGGIPGELGTLFNLQDLELCENQLSGPVPAELGTLLNLQYLRICNNRLTGVLPSELKQLSKLLVFHAAYNELDVTSEESVDVISTLQAQRTDVVYLPQNASQVELTLRRCNPTSYSNLTSDDLESALIPTTDPNTLSGQPTIQNGLVADGITPLLIQITTNVDTEDAVTYNVTFDKVLGGSISGGIAAHRILLQDGVWQTKSTFTANGSATVYAYISAIKCEDVSLTSADELTVTMHVRKADDASVTGSVTFRIRKPPVVFVHGYNSNACTWFTPRVRKNRLVTSSTCSAAAPPISSYLSIMERTEKPSVLAVLTLLWSLLQPTVFPRSLSI